MRYFVVDVFTKEHFCFPFWSERLSKTVLTAKQLSKRGGSLYCRDLDSHVEISGNAVTHLIGEILI